MLCTQIWVHSETQTPLNPCVRRCEGDDDCAKKEECSERNTCVPRVCPDAVYKGEVILDHGR